MGQDGLEIFFIGAILSMLILSVGFVLFTIFLFKYKRSSMLDQQRQEIEYIRTIAEAENEIKEETLTNIGRELHDNIGQILTVAKIRLDEVQEEIDHNGLKQVEETLLKAVDELRGLSRTLNTDRVKDVGLESVLASEMDRIDSLTRFTARMDVKGDPYRIEGDKEIVIYRIVQEFISNTLKHSGGSEVNLYLAYQPDGLRLKIEDNGLGFDIDAKDKSKRNGLYNMRSRANMIGASYSISSSEGEGTRLDLFIERNKQNV
jgi:signal transduction histidine kinase